MLPSCEANIIRKTVIGCYVLKWMSIIIITRLEHRLSLLLEIRRFTWTWLKLSDRFDSEAMSQARKILQEQAAIPIVDVFKVDLDGKLTATYSHFHKCRIELSTPLNRILTTV